ncbi:MAG: DUF6531 domain-containing protein [Chlamydiales bacterium]|nr:DUF6531 domain-containing protein [Chlamydiales bacterium]
MGRATLLLLLCLVKGMTAFAQQSPVHLPLAEVAGDTSSILAGCVNVITGSYSTAEVDIIIPGAQPVSFQRLYCSADWRGQGLSDGWNHNYLPGFASIGQEGGKYAIFIPESSGGTLSYRSTSDALIRKNEQGQHLGLCPIRAVQRAVADAASKISGMPVLEGYFEHSQVVTHHGTNENRQPIIVYNGMLTPFAEFMPRLDELSKANGNCTVIGSYNATHGFVGDVIECGLTLLGINTHAVEVGKQAIAAGFAADHTGKGIIALAHSQGGLTLHRSYTQFDDKMIDKIYAVTCGSAKIICDPRLAGYANDVDKLEFVTFLGDWTNYTKAFWGNSRMNVDWIGHYKGLPGSNHAFENYTKYVNYQIDRANDVLGKRR